MRIESIKAAPTCTSYEAYFTDRHQLNTDIRINFQIALRVNIEKVIIFTKSRNREIVVLAKRSHSYAARLPAIARRGGVENGFSGTLTSSK